MSPFTVWRCPEPGCEEFSSADSQNVCASVSCAGEGHPLAARTETFTVGEIRERLLSKEAREGAHRVSMERHSFRPYDEITRTLLEAAIDYAFPTQQEQPPTTTEGES